MSAVFTFSCVSLYHLYSYLYIQFMHFFHQCCKLDDHMKNAIARYFHPPSPRWLVTKLLSPMLKSCLFVFSHSLLGLHKLMGLTPAALELCIF